MVKVDEDHKASAWTKKALPIMKSRIKTILILVGAFVMTLAACSRHDTELTLSSHSVEEDIMPGMEMFAFRIGMSQAAFHDGIYRVSNFRRADGLRPRFGSDNDPSLLGHCQKLEDGRPKSIEAFFTDKHANQIDISYHSKTQDSRIQLFNHLHSNVSHRLQPFQVFTNNNMITLFHDGGDYILWIMNPNSEYDPIKVSIRSFSRAK